MRDWDDKSECYDRQPWGPNEQPVNVSCSNFKNAKTKARMHLKNKRWALEDSKNVMHCYFKSDFTQRGFRKRMIEIWAESSKFDRTSQRRVGQERLVFWLRDTRICGPVSREEQTEEVSPKRAE